MTALQPQFALEVLGGGDHGARLDVGATVRTIGRARDSDLVLSDLSASRRHLQVVASENGVQIEVCGTSAPFVVGGRPLRTFEASVGDRIHVGNTILVVTASERSSAPTSSRSRTDVRTVLTGVGADALAMVSVYDLIEALDAATDRIAVAGALESWSSRQRPACRVEIRTATSAESQVAQSTDRAETTVVVPAPSDEPMSVAFLVAGIGDDVTDSFRRMLVVAGRLYGSALSRVRREEIATGEVAALRALSFGAAHDFLGSSEEAKQLAARIPRLATSDVNILIEGETGVGKTFLARLIHEASPRAREPLRVINCAAIPENLVESELFGHERGAFTGAVGARAGAFEAVGRGTLFLDEIGELSMGSQAKLLRVLEERRFERIGSNKTLELHGRILCATNRDLEQLITRGEFRRDLLFRIAVVRVRVPSLRDRSDDLPELAGQLLRDAAQNAGRRVTGFSQAALKVIAEYSWPGNVRELRNAIEHAVALGEGPIVQAEDLPSALTLGAAQPEDLDLVRLPLDMATLEQRAVEAALRATGGNRLRAAALLGINRATLYNKLREFGLGA